MQHQRESLLQCPWLNYDDEEKEKGEGDDVDYDNDVVAAAAVADDVDACV